MDDTDQRLSWREATEHLLSDRLVPDPGDENFHHRKRDIGLQQRDADVAQRVLDIGLGQARLAAQRLDDTGKAAGKAIEHA